MSIQQRQDELFEGTIGFDIPPRLPKPFTLDNVVEVLGKNVRSVDYFVFDPNDTAYIAYSSWEAAFGAYREVYEFYAKSKQVHLPQLQGWRIELHIPQSFGGVALLDERVRLNKGF